MHDSKRDTGWENENFWSRAANFRFLRKAIPFYIIHHSVDCEHGIKTARIFF